MDGGCRFIEAGFFAAFAGVSPALFFTDGRANIPDDDRLLALLQHEPLGAVIVDDFCRVEIAFRVGGHVVDNVELTGAFAAHADYADLRHRGALENHNPHRAGVHNLEKLLLAVWREGEDHVVAKKRLAH